MGMRCTIHRVNAIIEPCIEALEAETRAMGSIAMSRNHQGCRLLSLVDVAVLGCSLLFRFDYGMRHTFR